MTLRGMAFCLAWLVVAEAFPHYSRLVFEANQAVDDVDARLRTHGIPTKTWSIGKPVYDLEYADDTMLMSVTTSQIQEILCSLQVEATLYTETTEILVHPNAPDPDVRFVDGTKVNTVYCAKYLGTQVAWEHTTKYAMEARKTKAHAAHMKLQNLWRSRLRWRAKARPFHSYLVSVLIYGLDSLTLEDKHLRSIDGWYFQYLRRAMSIKASYYSHVTNQTVWRKAHRPTLSSQTLLSYQQKRLTPALLSPHDDPLHHVIFSPGYKDRIKFSRSRHKGHPAPYCFNLVSTQAVHLLQTYPDHSAIPRRDFLGVKQPTHTAPRFRWHLQTAPTCDAKEFKFLRRTVGGAWLT